MKPVTVWGMVIVATFATALLGAYITKSAGPLWLCVLPFLIDIKVSNKED